MSKNSISVTQYHQRSKHSLQQYARGPHGLDWATQPNPFREFTGCTQFALPLAAQHVTTAFADIYLREKISPASIDVHSLGAMFELAMGLSAWKVYGDSRWALRKNPPAIVMSSGL